jgi:murein DD-endopeptidase MepM/ murein hydrolase activator NlpD
MNRLASAAALAAAVLALAPARAGATAASSPSPSVTRILNRRIERNQTVAQALRATGLPEEQIEAIVGALTGVFDFRRSRPLDQFRVVIRNGVVDFFDYRQGALDEWHVRRDGDRLVGSRREVEVERRVEAVELRVQSSLYESAVAAGEDPVIALALADVFAWDIDFYQDVRRGDVARAVVEKYLTAGRVIRYGEVLAAQYQGEAVGRKRVFRYQPPAGAASYFEESGASARKSFLKSPLKYAHVTSGFGSRFHPVLRYVKDHNGVDYGAPVGTPVWAVADGTVVKAAHDAAAGKHVCLRHPNGMETCYLHLSRFGPGVRQGARVAQKQVIAFTGNTGRTTGPHLHFALKRGGAFVNPLRQTFPRADPLPKKLLPDFREKIAPLATLLDATAVADSTAAAPASARRGASLAP